MAKKMGRPQIQIDWDQFDKLCALQCTKREIADFLDISEDTIEKALRRDHDTTFTVYYEQKASKGKVSLRRKQYETAMGGNVTMLIWLGKQILDQKEKSHVENAIDPKLAQRVRELDSLSTEELEKIKAGK